MTAGEFQAAIRPKVNVTRNMHKLLPEDLDFFICMSSVAGIVGSRGQGNYNAGKGLQNIGVLRFDLTFPQETHTKTQWHVIGGPKALMQPALILELLRALVLPQIKVSPRSVSWPKVLQSG